MKEPKITVGQEMLQLISGLDEFKGRWLTTGSDFSTVSFLIVVRSSRDLPLSVRLFSSFAQA